jgi:UDP-glucose:(heptosyl)LPS alpha-1,3-glucosyltransferase
VADSSLIDGMTFHPVPYKFAFSSVLNTLSFIRETHKMLDNSSFDIIHSHERNYAVEILTLHSFSYLSGLDNYSGFRRIDQKYFSLRSLCYLWLENKQMASPWLISVSDKIAKDVRDRYHRTENISVISPGVDIELFHPVLIAKERERSRNLAKFRDDELVILFIGSAFKRKGLDRLLPAITQGMRLIVVGTGDHLKRINRLVNAYNIQNQVSFMGFDENIIKYYAAADVVVLPSRSEAFGMSILEAMACGLPVIVSANSGVASLIAHQENGFILNNPNELPDLLKSMFSEQRRKAIGDRARATAQRHTWANAAAAHVDLYHRVVADKHRNTAGD